MKKTSKFDHALFALVQSSRHRLTFEHESVNRIQEISKALDTSADTTNQLAELHKTFSQIVRRLPKKSDAFDLMRGGTSLDTTLSKLYNGQP